MSPPLPLSPPGSPLLQSLSMGTRYCHPLLFDSYPSSCSHLSSDDPFSCCHFLSLTGGLSPLLSHPPLHGHSPCHLWVVSRCHPPSPTVTPFPWQAVTLLPTSPLHLWSSPRPRCHPLSSAGERTPFDREGPTVPPSLRPLFCGHAPRGPRLAVRVTCAAPRPAPVGTFSRRGGPAWVCPVWLPAIWDGAGRAETASGVAPLRGVGAPTWADPPQVFPRWVFQESRFCPGVSVGLATYWELP